MKLFIGANSVSNPKCKAIHERAREVFDEIVLNPYGRTMTEDEVLQYWKDADAIIAGTEPYTRTMLEAAPKTLKVISRHGVGLETVDLETARKRGITVCNTPGANADAVAEATIGLILSVLRRIPLSDRRIHENRWTRYDGQLFKGKTLGVIGMGHIGKGVILRSEPFGVHFIAYDPFFDETFASIHNVERANLETVLKQADIVSLHLPVTPETHHIINTDTLAEMKPGAILINTARGELIDESALFDALKSNRLGGAGIDVYSHEPLHESPFFTLDNVVLTPHMAGNTSETTLAMGMWALENAVKVVTGQDGAAVVK